MTTPEDAIREARQHIAQAAIALATAALAGGAKEGLMAAIDALMAVMRALDAKL